MLRNFPIAIIALWLLAAACGPLRAAPADETRSVTLAAVGDILFDRGVREEIERRGADTVFAEVRAILSSADIAAGNLECPLTDRHEPRPMRYVFRCDPARAATLAAAGFDAVTLANNHILDQGRGGLLDTIEHLHAAGVTPVGAGPDAVAARQPVIVERNGMRLALLAFLDMPIEGAVYLEDMPGPATAGSADAVREAVRDAREQADAVVVFFHWGVEFSARPARAQRELARAAADAGASLVIGHHPHVLQPWERMGDTLVVYSLGNFVFDQGSRPSASQSAILLATLTSQGVEHFEFVPVSIINTRPYPATGEAADRIRAVLSGISTYGIFE